MEWWIREMQGHGTYIYFNRLCSVTASFETEVGGRTLTASRSRGIFHLPSDMFRLPLYLAVGREGLEAAMTISSLMGLDA